MWSHIYLFSASLKEIDILISLCVKAN